MAKRVFIMTAAFAMSFLDLSTPYPVLALYSCCWWCHTPDISYDWNSIVSSKTGLLFCLWACTHSTNFYAVV